MTAPAPRLQLPDVTLVCVDTGTPAASLAAVQHCLRQIEFGDVLLFTDPACVPDAPREVHLRGVQIRDSLSYSDFLLDELASQVFTSHALIVQRHAFVRDAAQWHPDFLLYDYIGAPMRGLPAQRCVGHGAFSLRSRRLLVALRMAALDRRYPDDQAICQSHREHLERVHDIRFAPLELAQRFSQARTATHQPTFGFQGLQHLPQVLDVQAIHDLVASLPDESLRGAGAADLCAAMLRAGQLETAASILAARTRDGRRDARSVKLRLQLAMARWHHRRQSVFHA